MDTSISLDRLVPAPENVRRTGRGEGIETLAASIEAHGLLHALLVRPNGAKFAVVAGRRRLAAMKLLARRRRLERAHPVPCRLLGDGEDAVELSLAENVQRADMHPVDRFEAFAALADRGHAPAEIAARFGLAEAAVGRLLRLGQLHPEIRAAYRDGRIADHRTACAFALFPDPEEQKRVFEELSAQYGNASVPAWAVRERLTAGRLQAGTALARFVRAEYERLGHPVERDLFSEDEEIWLDRRLAVEVAEGLLARAAERLRAEGWGWVEVGLTRPQDCWRLTRLEPEEGGGWSAARKAQGGCIVTIAADGSLAVEQGLQRPEDRPAEQTEETVSEPPGDDPAASEPAGPVLSASLRRDLEAVRTRVFQACLASDPAWAQAVLLERLAGALFGAEAGFREPVCRIRPVREAGDGRPEAACPKAEAHLAGLEARFRPLMAGAPLDRLKAIAALDADDRAQLLALCVALTCRAPCADGPDERIEHVGAALGIDLAGWWRPGEEGFWARVTKRVMAGVLAEAGVDQIPVAAMRKPDAVRLLADLTSEAESERARAWPKARARLSRWLPDGLAFGRSGREEEDGPDPDPDPLPAAAPVPDDEEEPEDELPAAA